MKRQTRLTAYATFTLILVAVTIPACTASRVAARQGVPKSGPTPSPSTASSGAVTAPVPPPPGSSVDVVIHDARALFELGVARYQRGEMEEARANFDRAIERMSSGPTGARSDPRLSDAYDDLLNEIQELEAASYKDGAGLSPKDEVPSAVLEEIVPEITPEQAAVDRRLAQDTAAESDLPVVLNDRVLAWIETYRGPMHERFQEALTRSGRYIDMARRILREEGLPEDLCYMAQVESAWKPYAYSRARAKGVWQFIVSTGARYNLKRNWWIDERSDPELATRAAASYLKYLHEMFGDWYLAIAAYNAGEGKIGRALARTGHKDFWSIAQTSHIRLETKNYVPAILATLTISKDPEKFGFVTDREPAVVYDSVTIDSPTDLRVIARIAETSVDELQRLNPALSRLQTPPGYPDFLLHVPKGTGEDFASTFSLVARTERIPWKSHEVAGGETLAAISRRYGVSVARIREANSLVPQQSVRAGAVLQIPTYIAPSNGAHADLARSSEPGPRVSGVKKVHRVKRGDTLSSIARRYRTSVETLRALNHLRPGSVLRSGAKLVVYQGRRARVSSGQVARHSTSSKAVSRVAEAKRPGSTKSRTSRARAASKTYRVRQGDTLFKIASRLSTSVDRICRVNNLSAADPLRPGTVLRIEH